MKESLKKLVQHQCDQIRLSDEQLSALEELMIQSAEKDGRPQRRFHLTVALAALVFVAAVTAIMVMQFPGKNIADMPQMIAKEVVKNHLKLKPMEVTTGSISEVRRYFSRLDFMPIESRLLVSTDLQLIGGRYCSIQGVTAAQLRLQQGENLQTLYQTEYLPEVFGDLPRLDKGEQPLSVYSRGIRVEIWVEKDLLFALTDAPGT